MKLPIDRNSRIPLYQQLARGLEYMIRSSRLPDGFKLPSERRLAMENDVHRNTVIKAYDVLIAAGIVAVSSQSPKGYFVRTVAEGQEFGKRFFPLEKAFRYEHRRAEKEFDAIYWQSEEKSCISFGGMVMDSSIVPVENMEGAVKRIFHMGNGGTITALNQETERLRRNICGLLTQQHIYVTTKNIQILAESNQIISYLTTLYMREGDCVIAEEPMVPDNFSIFYNRGIKVVTVPMEEDGVRLDALEDAVRKWKPKFIYTIPNYHNPTGITMSVEKRQRLLDMANVYNVPIIEEDYHRDFDYAQKCPPSLYALDNNRLVIYVSTFTLTFPYMMKIGYTVGPADFIDMLGYALEVDETAVGGIGQYFLNDYIESGSYERNLRNMREVYCRRLQLLCGELAKLRSKGLAFRDPEGGLLVWCTLDEEIDERRFCRMAAEKGVIVVPGWCFYEEEKGKNGHVRLCFSRATEEQILQGTAILGEVLDECRREKNE